MFGKIRKHEDAGIHIERIIKAQKSAKLPKDIWQLDNSYKELVRELSKR